MSDWIRHAATNNASWCDIVCRSHGATTTLTGDAWVSHTRTPPLYPDAVTLSPTASAAEMLAAIDTSPGCSVKDSFSCLDLAPYGFRVLFEAHWILLESDFERQRDENSRGHPEWKVVGTSEQLAQWESVWSGGQGHDRLFRDDLLDRTDVFFLAGELHDTIVAGTIVATTDTVAGLSNYFEASPTADAWPTCSVLIRSLCRQTPIVGYERDDALVGARQRGFIVGGPLRVWVN
jgi:hypothetical protein